MSNGLNYKGQNLVFIVGCPRSGTTWLQRLLAHHPKVRTGQESNIFEVNIGPQLRYWHQGSSPQNRGGLGLACYFTEEEFYRVLKSFLMTLLQPLIGPLQPGEIFVEKTPSHALFIPEIVELLPESRIIHVLRDPRDVVASLLAASHSWGSNWAPGNPVAAVRMWIKHVTSVQQVRKALPSWQFHEVRYENLYRSPESTLKECSNFLDLEWNDKEISKAIEVNQPTVVVATGGTAIPLGGEVAKRSGPVVTEPLGFIRQAKAGSWRTDLTIRDRFRLWRIARKPMAEMGYYWPFFILS
jgi:hypothetical protein